MGNSIVYVPIAIPPDNPVDRQLWELVAYLDKQVFELRERVDYLMLQHTKTKDDGR